VIVGVPREVKTHEYRVGLTPTSVRELVSHGHQVVVEKGAGLGIGAPDALYEKAGARIGGPWQEAELIVKVKEPQKAERAKITSKHVLFTYLHLAPDPQQTADLQASGAICIAYETVTRQGGGLPLLAPMSEVAGRMSVQVGGTCLEKERGGMGILLGGVPGVPPAKITILGAGVAGSSAARMAVGSGARVYVLDRSLDVLRRVEAEFGARAVTVYSSRDAVEQHVLSADLVIGAVLVPGAAAPKLVSRAMVTACARPWPRAAPVMRATFPSSLPTMGSFVFQKTILRCLRSQRRAIKRHRSAAIFFSRFVRKNRFRLLPTMLSPACAGG